MMKYFLCEVCYQSIFQVSFNTSHKILLRDLVFGFNIGTVLKIGHFCDLNMPKYEYHRIKIHDEILAANFGDFDCCKGNDG